MSARVPNARAALVLFALAALCAGCPQESTSVPGRVNAASGAAGESSAAKRAKIAAGFCDVTHAAGKGPRFELPKLAGAAAPELGGGKRLWVNVWATWCKPCVAELPLLSRWPARLAGVRFVMLSADADADALRAFYKRRPKTPRGPRLADADAKALAAWLGKYGLAAGASLPVHFFVGADQRVRCVRAATLRSSDYPRVAAMLAP
ncbi:MAG: redoxin family protein [Myxococcales bacterium]|nr:redoxin family protein [Myxococcales bacterium]